MIAGNVQEVEKSPEKITVSSGFSHAVLNYSSRFSQISQICGDISGNFCGVPGDFGVFLWEFYEVTNSFQRVLVDFKTTKHSRVFGRVSRDFSGLQGPSKGVCKGFMECQDALVAFQRISADFRRIQGISLEF